MFYLHWLCHLWPTDELQNLFRFLSHSRWPNLPPFFAQIPHHIRCLSKFVSNLITKKVTTFGDPIYFPINSLKNLSLNLVKIVCHHIFHKMYHQMHHQTHHPSWGFTKLVTEFVNNFVTNFVTNFFTKFVTKCITKCFTKYCDSQHLSPNSSLNLTQNMVIH